MDSPSSDPSSAGDNFKSQLINSLILQRTSDNPYITREAYVLRILKDIAKAAHVSLCNIVNNNRSLILDDDLHRLIHETWEKRTRNVTAEEENCFKRLMGHDHVKPQEFVKYGMFLNKTPSTRNDQKLFAVDGFLGSEFKPYVESFKTWEGFKEAHTRAVREMYDRVGTVKEMHEILLSVFDRQESTWLTWYMERVPNFEEVVEWKMRQLSDAEERTSNDEPSNIDEGETKEHVKQRVKKRKVRDNPLTKTLSE